MVADSSIKSFNNRLFEWDENIKAIDKELTRIGLYFPIDEVAVMFGTKAKAYSFIETAIASSNGTKLFNAASDKVETSPLRSKYLVDYLFVELGGRAYRLECMVLQQGHSPLHAALRDNERVDAEPTVHYSFKTHSSKEYTDARRFLDAREWTLAQSCLSTYGAFSYYLMGPNSAGRLTEQGKGDLAENAYIKPRVNLRDQPYMSRKAI